MGKGGKHPLCFFFLLIRINNGPTHARPAASNLQRHTLALQSLRCTPLFLRLYLLLSTVLMYSYQLTNHVMIYTVEAACPGRATSYPCNDWLVDLLSPVIAF